MKNKDIPVLVKKILRYNFQLSDLFSIARNNPYDTLCHISFYIENKYSILICLIENDEIIIDKRFEHYLGENIFTVDNNTAKLITSKLYHTIEQLIKADFKYTTDHFKFIPEKLRIKYEHLIVSNELGLL